MTLKRLTLVIDGEAHADRWVMTGTHDGELHGIPTVAVMTGYRRSARRISSALHGRRSSDSVASKQTEPAVTVFMCATRCPAGGVKANS